MGILDFFTGNAAKRAANAQTGALNQGLGLQQDHRNELTSLFQPAIDRGNQFQGTLADFLGVNGSQAAQDAFGTFNESPGLNFLREQGQRGIDNSAAARGDLLSGRTIADSAKFNQGLAQQDFGNHISRLMQLAGQGAQDRGVFANALTGNTNNQTNILGQIGRVQSDGIINKQNVQNQGLQSLFNIGSRVAGNFF